MTSRPDTSAPVPLGEPRVDALDVDDNLYRRLRWRKHSIRQGKRLGLPTIRYGSRDCIIGAGVVEWFRCLGSRQREADKQEEATA